MINPAQLLKIKGAWETFSANHPKFIKFVGAIGKDSMEEGTIIEINVTTTDGKTTGSNIKLTQSDLALFKTLSEMAK